MTKPRRSARRPRSSPKTAAGGRDVGKPAGYTASGWRRFVRQLGPGVITGAADDDPSGIGTYSQVGAQFGLTLLWSIPFSLPLMCAVQEISGRIGRVTGKGLAANLLNYPRWLVGTLVLLPFAGPALEELGRAPWSAIVAVVYLGIFPTAVGFTLWAYALTRTDAGAMAATTLSVPGIVVLMSWAVLGELPTVAGLLGGALCLLGVAISRRRVRR